jgi:8-oxo-dGTP pyrophosphatase MutT (NUDIX family)
MTADNSPIKTVASRKVYENRWITVYEDKTIMPNGKDGVYGYIASKDSVITAVIDGQNRICMVHAFRYPSKSWGWELPGGSGDGEDLTQAALREVEEETGIVAKHCEKLGETLICNGFMTERMASCVAYDLRYDGEKDDEEVFKGMRFFNLAEIEKLIEDGEINDGQTITGLYFAKRWLAKRGVV